MYFLSLLFARYCAKHCGELERHFWPLGGSNSNTQPPMVSTVSSKIIFFNKSEFFNKFKEE